MNTHGNYWGGSPNSLETDDGELARILTKYGNLKRENTRLKRTVTELGKDNASLKKSVKTITANFEELRKERIALEKIHGQLNVDFEKMVNYAIKQTKEIEGLKSSIFTEGYNG